MATAQLPLRFSVIAGRWTLCMRIPATYIAGPLESGEPLDELHLAHCWNAKRLSPAL